MARLARADTKPDDVLVRAAERLRGLGARAALDEAHGFLAGLRPSRLDGLPRATERAPRAGALDGRLLEAVAARALARRHGAVFTGAAEGRILAAFALARAAEARGGPPPVAGVAALLGTRPAPASLRRALDGLAVLDPACGGGALLVAAELLAARVGARLALSGRDVSPVAARAASLRLALLGARADVRRGDALATGWPACDALLMNPPFLRHEAMPAAWKARAARASGLSRQADLSAHLVLLALRRSPVCGLVLPRALSVSRSAGPLRAEARARGGFVLSLRSRAAGSFAASVDTSLAVWAEGARDAPAAEATAPLERLRDRELAALAAGRGGARIHLAARAGPARHRGVRLGDACEVRFGLKTGANAFFHLRPLGGDRYASALCGEVRLEAGDVAPLLSGLREALAPELAVPAFVLFRPASPSAAALDYVRRGEERGVDRRPTCAARRTWWQVVPGRAAAPVLYPAKVGARAFAFHNAGGLLEDKKWHALFPRDLEPWAVALLLSATPVRLAVERGARQLTGAQAIADIDCGVLAAAPFPDPASLGPARDELAAIHGALARDPVTTDLDAMLARPAQRALDLAAGTLLGLSRTAVAAARRELAARVAERLARAERVREAIRTRT